MMAVFADMRALARRLGGDVAGHDSILMPGPKHSSRDRSLHVTFKPGAPDGFTVHSFTDDWPACKDHVRGLLGIAEWQPSEAIAQAKTPPAKAGVDTKRLALKIWNDAGDVGGTLAALYLDRRKLVLPVGVSGRDLRFHPNCPFGKDQRHPALIGLLVDIHGDQPAGIQRIALTPDGEQLGKRMLGRKVGCAVKISPDENVTLGLAIGEGVETVLGGLALGFCPAWATGDAGGIRSFPVLAGINALTIFVDADQSDTGQIAARECSARWTAAGCEVLRVTPNRIGEDLADIAKRRATA